MSETTFQVVPLDQLRESPFNPRRTFEESALAELTASVREQGILVPLLVRPAGKGYEVVAGARRLRAARAAGLKEVPALVRELTEAQALEAQVIENLQRADVHPLEEAEGYRRLTERPPRGAGYTVSQIAERVGRSVKYVYDRMKLLALTKEAQAHFTAGKITAGHAILLARLKPADQARAMDVDGRALFEEEHLLWHPDAQAEDAVKPVSVRELQAWIDEHVKFDKAAADPMLFPETVGTLQAAQEQAERVVQITHDHYVRPEARDEKERIFGPRSWKRADGKARSKACPHAVTGVLVVGPGRGEAFRVCTNKEKCQVHWAAERKARAAGRSPAGRVGQPARNREQEKWEARHRKEEAERARWKKAAPAILEAVAARVAKLPTKATGLLGQILLEECRGLGRSQATAARYVPLGSSAEDLVRHAAFLVVWGELEAYEAPEVFPKRAKALGLDVRTILDAAAPAAAASPAQTSARGLVAPPGRG